VDRLNQILTNVKAMQLTIDKLLERGTLALKDPHGESATVANTWVLEPLYQNEDCSVGFVHIPHVELGKCETHVHQHSIEYLIVVKGSILLNIDGRDVRVVREGECCAVEAGVLHHSKPLTDDTKLVYVCIPEDKNMPLPKMEKL
jgi:mannose-6-phosphate isomerase-like protein (cupin superfamily)